MCKKSSEKSVSVFFFQAEDGIRVGRVTGVQTCALPIFFADRPFFRAHVGSDCRRATHEREEERNGCNMTWFVHDVCSGLIAGRAQDGHNESADRKSVV